MNDSKYPSIDDAIKLVIEMIKIYEKKDLLVDVLIHNTLLGILKKIKQNL